MRNFDPADIKFFHLLRKVLALILASTVLSLLTEFNKFYGPDGWINPQLIQMQQSLAGLGIQSWTEWIHAQVGISYLPLHWLVITLYLSLCLCFALNYFARVATILLLLLDISIFSINTPYSYGADAIRTSLLFYLVFIPRRPNYYMWAYIRVVQVHLCIIYFFGGLEKALGNSWWNGEAIWKTINLPYFQQGYRWHIDLLQEHPWLAVLAGWLIILLELFYPLAVYIARSRFIWLTAIALMHTGIAMLMGLWNFSLLMLTWNFGAIIIGWLAIKTYYPKNPLKFNLSRGRRPQMPRSKTHPLKKRKEAPVHYPTGFI